MVAWYHTEGRILDTRGTFVAVMPSFMHAVRRPIPRVPVQYRTRWHSFFVKALFNHWSNTESVQVLLYKRGKKTEGSVSVFSFKKKPRERGYVRQVPRLCVSILFYRPGLSLPV